MNKLKYALLFIFLSTLLYSQERAGYSFKDVGTWYDVAGPKRWLFGNSTVFHDSTNYLTINKSLYILDSMKVAKDLYIGVKGGKIYLDTNREGQLYYTGLDLYLENTKSGGFHSYYTTGLTSGYQWLYTSEGSYHFMSLDTSGLNIQRGGLTITNTASTKDDIEFSDDYSTQQVKINGGDSVFTDWDANDAVTCNLQSGLLETKSLTTAQDADYTLTVTNSLATTTSRIFAQVSTNPGAGAPFVRQVATGSGSFTVIIRNIDAASLNSEVGIQFFIINSP